VAHIDAAEFDGQLEMSGIALAPRRTSEVLLVSDKPLRAGLSADPTALRGFRAADGLSAYGEVYTDIRDEFLVSRLPSARVASVTATLTTAAGGFVARAQGERVLSEPDGRNAREGFRMDFDLARVSPGRHVLTIEARSSQTGTRTVRRQIPITVE
jgi:hypothetical protein